MGGGECDVSIRSKLYRYCNTCKHCKEDFVVDLCGCPEPVFRCKAKNRTIIYPNSPKPYCVFFEASVPKSEMLDTERLEPIDKPKSTNCPNCGAPVDIPAEKCAYCDTPYI